MRRTLALVQQLSSVAMLCGLVFNGIPTLVATCLLPSNTAGISFALQYCQYLSNGTTTPSSRKPILSSLVSKTLLDGWYSRAGSDDACRLHAYAVDGSAAALGFTPSHTHLTPLYPDPISLPS